MAKKDRMIGWIGHIIAIPRADKEIEQLIRLYADSNAQEKGSMRHFSHFGSWAEHCLEETTWAILKAMFHSRPDDTVSMKEFVRRHKALVAENLKQDVVREQMEFHKFLCNLRVRKSG